MPGDRYSTGDVPRIGIAGHGDLTGSSLVGVETALRAVLVPYRSRRFVGVSCLAPGVDRLFGRMVLNLGGRLEVVLPAADYRDTQVAACDAPIFDWLLDAASSVRVMSFQRSSRQACVAANAAMLAVVDRLIAVWDGYPATRPGSTGDVVTTARELGLPTTVLWPPGSARAADIPAPTRNHSPIGRPVRIGRRPAVG